MSAKKTQIASDKSPLQLYFEEAKTLIDADLQALAPVISELKLHDQIEYALQTEGKRLRSSLVFLCGESVSGRREDLRSLALAVELLHSATLVHDDILDQDLFRRNTLSVQARWSVKEAILVGDALASLALRLCRGYGDQILDVMAETCLQLSDGEYMDVELANEGASEADYLEKVKKKSASLFKAAAQSGALAAGSSASEASALAGFGENYGVAFQIRDDVADATLTADKEPSDLNEYRATLPLIHLRQNAPENAQKLLHKLTSKSAKSMDLLGKRELLDKLRVCFEDSGSFVYCADKIDAYADRALACLAPLRETPYKTLLAQMADSLRLNPRP
jgi:geranylgeranyl pyrophosphate synthase